MATYNSDSSGAEGPEYTETNVLLGYASREPSDDTISHLGGHPAWLDPAIPPSAALARCKECKDLMVLLLQLNGDLPEIFPGHERRLYVLACRRKTCRRKGGSVRALRGVRISEALTKDRQKPTGNESKPAAQSQMRPVTSTNIGESLFGVKPTGTSSSPNPFSISPSSVRTTSINPFTASNLAPLSALAAIPPQKPINTAELSKTFASVVSLNSDPPTYGPVLPPEPWPQESEFPPPYPLYYLVDADYETLDKVSNEAHAPHQAMDVDEDASSSSQKEDKDVYESTIDKTFQKFADRLAQNPEQVIRYEFQGQPLLYSKTDAVGKLLAPAHAPNAKVTVQQGGPSGSRIPPCGNCGSRRVFEVQLTPHAITELEADDAGLEGMEWGTIIVGVCATDCLPLGSHPGGLAYAEECLAYAEEWAGVQWEEVKER